MTPVRKGGDKLDPGNFVQFQWCLWWLTLEKVIVTQLTG